MTDNVATVVYHVVDDIAERFLDLIDDLDDEIDELEDQVEDWQSSAGARPRSPASGTTCFTSGGRCADARRGPARRRQRVEFAGGRGLHRTTSSSTSATPTTSCCARATASSSRATSSPASATTTRRRSRTSQNEVMKRLTVIASILLAADVHRRALRPELRPHARAALELGLLLVARADRGLDAAPARVLQVEEVDLSPPRPNRLDDARGGRVACPSIDLGG